MKARIQLSRRLVTVLQALVLLAVAGALFASTAYFSAQRAVFGNEVRVPRILEMELESARQVLSPLDLRVESTGSRHNDLVPAGQVLSQDPMPDSKFKRGRKVKVTMSLGPEQHVVPELGGMPIPRARVLLRQDKMRLGQVAYAYAEPSEGDNDENLVLAQDPPAGARIEEDARVDFLVSRGQPPRVWVMPDLVGRPLDQARVVLEAHGFRIGNIRRVADSSQAPGRIQRQYPQAGYPVRRDDLISLVISGGEEGPS